MVVGSKTFPFPETFWLSVLGGLKTMADLIVKSKVAEMIRGKDMMIASDAYDALNEHVEKTVHKAMERCSAGGRKTVKPFDF